MRKALIVWGGWEGHQPKEVAAIFEGLLRKEDFDVTVSDTLDAYKNEELMKQLDLIVPIWTMSTIEKEQLRPLLDTVSAGCGIAGCHGGMSDSFRNEHLSELGSGCTGRTEYRRRLPGFLASFRDRSYTVEDIVEQARESSTDVVVRYRLRATYADGPVADAPIDIPGVMWFSVHDDRISTRVDVWDSLTFLRQTGQAPDA